MNYDYYGSDEALATLRRKLTGNTTLGVFLLDGHGMSFDNVDPASLNYNEDNGIPYLVFRSGQRIFRIPNVRYWTEQ